MDDKPANYHKINFKPSVGSRMTHFQVERISRIERVEIHHYKKKLGSIWFAHNPYLKTHISKLITHISIPTITQISLKFVFGSKSKLYLSLSNSIFWQNSGAHPLSLHRTVIWVLACDILSLHFTALPSHHKTQQLISHLYTPQNPFHITNKRLVPSHFQHRFSMNFFSYSAHIFPIPSSKFQIFFLLPIDQKPHIQTLFKRNKEIRKKLDLSFSSPHHNNQTHANKPTN